MGNAIYVDGGNMKLSEKDVVDIRNLYINGKKPKYIILKYNITYLTFSKIVNYKDRYKNII